MPGKRCDHVADYTFLRGPDPAGSNFAKLDELQRQHRPYLRTEEADGDWGLLGGTMLLRFGY